MIEDIEYKIAMWMIEKIWIHEGGPVLDILVDFVIKYEKKHYPIDPPTEAEAIKFRKDQES